MLKYRKMSTFNADWGAAAVMEGQPPAPYREDVWQPRMWGRPEEKPFSTYLDPEFPPGAHLWELVFHYRDEGAREGLVMAYEHVDGVRTGMVALLRPGWSRDVAERERLRGDERSDDWLYRTPYLNMTDYALPGESPTFLDRDGLMTDLPWED